MGLYAEQWLGGVDAARAHGCDLICFFGRSLDDPGFQRQANAIYDLVTEESVDGLVVWTTALGGHVSQERTDQFIRRFDRLPMVTVEQPVAGRPAVLMAEWQGMGEAVSHLIEVHGYRRIAFIRGARTHSGAQRRYQGYLDAMARHGLPVPPELVSAPLDYPEMVAAPVNGMLRLPEPPDAIATAHDDFAVAILATLAAAGVGTPEDIAVVGFDDRIALQLDPSTVVSLAAAAELPPGGALDPLGTRLDLYFNVRGHDWPGWVDQPFNLNALSLTTVRAPFYEMGRRAVEVLAGLMRGETVPPVVEIPTELVVRHTCGCPPDAPVVAAVDAAPSVATPEHHHVQLRDAVADSSAQLPDDWPERLSSAFIGETMGGSDGDFRALLSHFLPLSLWSGERAEHWLRVLSTLRRLIDDTTAGSVASTRADDLLRYGQTLLSETTEKYWQYARVLGEKRDQIVRDVGRELITAQDFAGLAEALARELPKLSIPGCYVAWYEPVMQGYQHPAKLEVVASRARSRLLLAYEGGAPVEVDADASVFPSVQLVPGGGLQRSSPSSMVTLPLYFRDQQLGFVLFELGPRIGWIYTTLQEQLSSALHRALLIERDRTARAAIEKGHRRAERQRLAAELHDSVSQALFSMTLHTRALELLIQKDREDYRDELARGLTELRELTQSALAEMRTLIMQMRPESLHEEGLIVSIRRHVATLAAREGLKFDFHAPDSPLSLEERAEEELRRVVQEALHNTVKHAHAQQIEVNIWMPADPAGTLAVEIADDGVGFDPDIDRPGHLGLHIMRERVERIGGRLTIDSSPTKSTTIRAILPLVTPQDGIDTS